MPFLELQTNQSPPQHGENKFMDAAVTAVARELKKPENIFMTAAHIHVNMQMGGSREPVACIDLAALGLEDNETGPLTAMLCHLATKHLGVSPERVFVRFQNYERSMWGCDGKTFA